MHFSYLCIKSELKELRACKVLPVMSLYQVCSIEIESHIEFYSMESQLILLTFHGWKEYFSCDLPITPPQKKKMPVKYIVFDIYFMIE